MSIARFRVRARMHMASRETEGTVTIDRDTGMFIVRPLRSRRTYELSLNDIAGDVVRRVLWAELMAKKREKAAKRKERRRS